MSLEHKVRQIIKRTSVDGDGNSGPAPIPVSAVSVYPCDSTQGDISKAPADLAGIDPMALGTGVTAAEVWTNAGYATTKAAVNGVIYSSRRPNFATDLIVGSFVFNIPATAALSFFAGSSAFGAGNTGVQIGVANNLLAVYVCGGGIASVQLQFIAPTIANDADHHCMFVCEPTRRAIYLWIDGVLCVSTQGAWPIGAGQWDTGMVFGQCRVNTSPSLAIAGKFKDITLAYQPGGVMPSNINEVAAALSADTARDVLTLAKPSISVDLFVAGQSNQSGQGVTAGVNTGVGSPIRDRTLPGGQVGKRSFYPTCANEIGKSGFTLQVYNHSIGGTGLRDSWCGHLGNWVSGQYVKRGSHRVYDGYVYRCAIAGQTAVNASTSAPTNGTGADSIPWVSVGPYVGQRMGVQRAGDTYYDPNGNISAMAVSIATSTAQLRVAYIAFGETDANQVVTRSEYSEALQVLATALRSAGRLDKIMLGHTLGTPSLVSYYDSTLIPAIADAVAAQGGITVMGFNMRAAYGILTITPASGIGLTDVYHGNNALYDIAGRGLGRNIVSALT